jgi:hypothetical protein
MEELDLEQLVKIYLTIRTQREKLSAEFEITDKKLKTEMTVIEQSMLAICNTAKAESIKTSFGTVIRNTKERFTCSDWGNFKDFVLEHQAVDLLERRIHQGNFKTFLSENEQDGLPPGVNVMREFGITVRKPTSK